MWQSDILKLGDGTVLVECGPMRMFIDAAVGKVKQPEECAKAGEFAIRCLAEVAENRDILSLPASTLTAPPSGVIPRRMWEACLAVDGSDLTSMAAVAGGISDAVADFLVNRGMTRVIVNNGGDIAVRLGEGDRVSLGIRPSVTASTVTHRIHLIPSMGIGGIATSGVGGRSLTSGVSSATTVFGRNTVFADAAATFIANRTEIDSTEIEQRSARQIDPDSDLGNREVTVRLGDLSADEIDQALDRGLRHARELCDVGMIAGAVIFVCGAMRATAGIVGRLEPMEELTTDVTGDRPGATAVAR